MEGEMDVIIKRIFPLPEGEEAYDEEERDALVNVIEYREQIGCHGDAKTPEEWKEEVQELIIGRRKMRPQECPKRTRY